MLSYGEKNEKIGPVDPEIISSEQSLKRKKLTQAHKALPAICSVG